MTAGIYRIDNIVNGKFYIGSSSNVEKRWKNHLYWLKVGKHQNLHLQRSFQKYGESAFTFTLIETCDGISLQDLHTKEQSYVTSLLPDYNKRCVSVMSNLGVRHTTEVRRKISEAVKRGYANPEKKAKRQVRKGYHIAGEQKEHLRQVNTGKRMTESAHKKLKAFWAGRQFGPLTADSIAKMKKTKQEHKEQISMSIKAAWQNPDKRERMLEGVRKGAKKRVLTDEGRERLREAGRQSAIRYKEQWAQYNQEHQQDA